MLTVYEPKQKNVKMNLSVKFLLVLNQVTLICYWNWTTVSINIYAHNELFCNFSIYRLCLRDFITVIPSPSITPQGMFLSPLTPISTASNVASSVQVLYEIFYNKFKKKNLFLIYNRLQYVGAIYVSEKKWELLNKINASGELNILGRFTRSPHIFSSTMVSIELTFYNHHSVSLSNVRMDQKV